MFSKCRHYRPFTSPEMDKLLVAMLRPGVEKEIVCAESSKYKLPFADEDLKELLHIVADFTSPPKRSKTRYQEALAYFKNNPEKLQDPDYQTIFKMLFLGFGSNHDLLKELESHRNFSGKLAAFLESTYKHYRFKIFCNHAVLFFRWPTIFQAIVLNKAFTRLHYQKFATFSLVKL